MLFHSRKSDGYILLKDNRFLKFKVSEIFINGGRFQSASAILSLQIRALRSMMVLTFFGHNNMRSQPF